MDLPLGIIAGLVTMASWGTADFFAKQVMMRIDTAEELVYTLAFAVLFLLPLVPFFWGTPHFTLTAIITLIIAAILNGVAVSIFIFALSKDKLSLITPIGSAYPLVTVMLGIFLAHEALSGAEMGGIALVLLGIFLASVPFSDLFSQKIKLSSGIIAALVTIPLWGAGFFLYKFFIHDLGWLPASLLVCVVQFIVLWPFAYLLSRGKRRADKKTVGLMVANMVCACAGLVAYSIGVSLERVSIVTPVSALFPIVAVGLGALFLKERVALSQYAGVACVITGIVLLSV